MPLRRRGYCLESACGGGSQRYFHGWRRHGPGACLDASDRERLRSHGFRPGAERGPDYDALGKQPRDRFGRRGYGPRLGLEDRQRYARAGSRRACAHLDDDARHDEGAGNGHRRHVLPPARHAGGLLCPCGRPRRQHGHHAPAACIEHRRALRRGTPLAEGGVRRGRQLPRRLCPQGLFRGRFSSSDPGGRQGARAVLCSRQTPSGGARARRLPAACHREGPRTARGQYGGPQAGLHAAGRGLRWTSPTVRRGRWSS